jgi:hypothetical protein
MLLSFLSPARIGPAVGVEHLERAAVLYWLPDPRLQHAGQRFVVRALGGFLAGQFDGGDPLRLALGHRQLVVPHPQDVHQRRPAPCEWCRRDARRRDTAEGEIDVGQMEADGANVHGRDVHDLLRVEAHALERSRCRQEQDAGTGGWLAQGNEALFLDLGPGVGEHHLRHAIGHVPGREAKVGVPLAAHARR